MRCDDIRELMSAHVDGCLDPAGEQRLADHLAACAACRQDLEALQRTLQLLHGMKPVAPPTDLTAKIHARLRRAQRSKIIEFLSLPQTRVALAASLLIVVTALGIRQAMSNPRPVPAALAPPVSVAGAPAIAPQTLPPAPVPPAEHAVHTRAADKAAAPRPDGGTFRKGMPATELVTVDGLAKEQASARLRMENRNAARNVVATESAKAEAAPFSASLGAAAAAPAEGLMAGERSRAVRSAGGVAHGAATAALAEAPAAAQARPAAKSAIMADAMVADGYTFRTDRIAEAAAIVNRRAGRKPELAAAARDNSSVAEKAVAQPVTLEVTLASSELPALLEELRRAGALLVSQPVAADSKRVAAPVPRTARAMGMTAAPAAAPSAPMFAGAVTADFSAESGAAPATIIVRFTFLPPAP